MDNLTLEELKLLERGMVSLWWEVQDGDQPQKDAIYDIGQKIKQAIADREFEEKRLKF